MTNLVIYTAIFGAKDILKPIQQWSGIECICYTDNEKITAPGWRIIHVAASIGASARLDAKRFKILPHQYFPDVEWSMWVDGTHVPLHNPLDLISQYGTHDLVAFRHPERDCIYDEGVKCIELGYSQATIEKQLARYEHEGFPSHYGLISATVLLRKHNQPEMQKAMNLWWAEISSGSIRDQLSLPYTLWRSSLSWAEIPGHVYMNCLFWYTPHGKQPNRLRDFMESKRASPNSLWRFVLKLKDIDWMGSLRR